MNIHLVIGASGLVGGHLLRSASARGIQAVGVGHAQPLPDMRSLDIRRRDAIHALLNEVRPSVVYLPAARTNVDYCEVHPQETYELNVLGVRNVVEEANALAAALVFFSSDYIFDGKAGPYREDAPAHPLSEYGRQKLSAEHYVALHARDFLIVRTTVVYGWESRGKNFVCRLLNTLKAGKTLDVPADQIGTPTYAPNLAEAVVELTLSGARGLYHVSGPDRVSRYDFALCAAKVFGLNEQGIRLVATSALRQPAPRPLNAGLISEKAIARLSVPLLGYKEGLRAMAESPPT